MQSRLSSGPLTHRRDFLPLSYGLALTDQKRRVMPVGTQVGVIVLYDNKLSVTY